MYFFFSEKNKQWRIDKIIILKVDINIFGNDNINKNNNDDTIPRNISLII